MPSLSKLLDVIAGDRPEFREKILEARKGKRGGVHNEEMER